VADSLLRHPAGSLLLDRRPLHGRRQDLGQGVRKQFLCRTLQLGAGSCGLASLGAVRTAAADGAGLPPDELTIVRGERDFILDWVSDLLDTMDGELPEATRIRLIEGCGRGCFRRHAFKRAITEQGKGDVEKLIEAYRRNFEAWRERDTVHVRYGEVSSRCYCPVAKGRSARPGDLHCECTRATHQTIFETALARPVKVEVVESLRRGGRTCHFVAHLAPA
jgi:hypothetical protein